MICFLEKLEGAYPGLLQQGEFPGFHRRNIDIDTAYFTVTDFCFVHCINRIENII